METIQRSANLVSDIFQNLSRVINIDYVMSRENILVDVCIHIIYRYMRVFMYTLPSIDLYWAAVYTEKPRRPLQWIPFFTLRTHFAFGQKRIISPIYGKMPSLTILQYVPKRFVHRLIFIFFISFIFATRCAFLLFQNFTPLIRCSTTHFRPIYRNYTLLSHEFQDTIVHYNNL